MSDYTEKLESTLFMAWNDFDNTEEDYSELVKFLNGNEFRTFGEGLSSMITMKAALKNGQSPMDHLVKAYKDKGIPAPSRNTLKNWFQEGLRPKKGEDSREKMFHIAFALDLSAEETAYLFHKIYLDRAFDFRNPKEIIYSYCIDKGFTFLHAVDLIEKLDKNTMDIEDGDRTIFTSVIEAQIAKLNTDDELLSYLQRHNHNFKMKNRKARALLSRQIKIAKESARKERMAFPMEEIAFGKSEESIDYLYETIISQSIQGETGTKSIFGNALLPKEIKTSFPQPTIFSKSEPTYDEIRKMLIFLFSYSFWVNMQIEKHDAEIDDYIEQLNSLLSEAGLPDLYYGNPHDWLYMYCALEENPLDTFRGIMAEVLCSDPNEIYDSAYNEE